MRRTMGIGMSAGGGSGKTSPVSTWFFSASSRAESPEESTSKARLMRPLPSAQIRTLRRRRASRVLSLRRKASAIGRLDFSGIPAEAAATTPAGTGTITTATGTTQPEVRRRAVGHGPGRAWRLIGLGIVLGLHFVGFDGGLFDHLGFPAGAGFWAEGVGGGGGG